MTLVMCPVCGGDGIETCDNPDHGFISVMGGDIGRLGCPVCGHDEDHKVRSWNRVTNKYEYNECPECKGRGIMEKEIALLLCEEYGIDNELIEIP